MASRIYDAGYDYVVLQPPTLKRQHGGYLIYGSGKTLHLCSFSAGLAVCALTSSYQGTCVTRRLRLAEGHCSGRLWPPSSALEVYLD